MPARTPREGSTLFFAAVAFASTARSPAPNQSAGRRRAVPVLAALCASGLAAGAIWPAAADAHGLVGRAYLPVPPWLFAWAAGAVLVVSFVALGRLWSSPKLEHARERRRLSLPAWLDPLCGALGIAGFVIVIVSGITGSQIPTANLAPTAIFVLFWVGLPLLSVVFGDVFRAFNPWRALARGLAFLWSKLARGPSRRSGRTHRRRGGPPLPYPSRLGRWPAVAGILAFAWLELVFVGREQPDTLAVLAVGYALVQLVGMAFFGIEPWNERGDAFAVAFNLFSRLSPLDYRHRAVWRRPPLAGLTELRALPGTVTLLCAMIGATTFDGFMNGPVWRAIAPSWQRDLGHLGVAGGARLELSSTLGLIACVLLCLGLYRAGVQGMSSVAAGRSAGELGGAFAHSLAPIAFGYLLAHYFSLLVTQGQASAYLVSDPLGTGANLFGTAGVKIDYGLISAALIWYVQVGALVCGHVCGLALAHDRALVLYGDSQAAADSQRWMLVVMVSFTCLGLWLLSAVNT